ncbi:MAG TPA: PD-(D/E)XK nuclease family protein [Acidimicrobiales bacterium]|nr:PD-(D/E)XK nuclease family protein [Acidimicrobiales bacterium]
MPYPVPRSLSPSKVTSFTDCALAFRFSVIDRLPEPPTPAATRGTLVHAALERLHLLEPAARTPDAALACLDDAAAELRSDPDYVALDLDADAAAAFHAEAADLVRNYFRLEDPRGVRAIGLELKVEAEIDGIRLRGIIDRLELDADGELVVTDYKTGGAPSTQYERKRLSGVHIYSLLCEQLLGRRPRAVQLLYLRDPLAITTEPTDRSTRGTRRTLGAVWQAVERACDREDFRPQPSRLCGYCAFQPYCPTYGGDPAEARRLAEQMAEQMAGQMAGHPAAAAPEPVPVPGAGSHAGNDRGSSSDSSNDSPAATAVTAGDPAAVTVAG